MSPRTVSNSSLSAAVSDCNCCSRVSCLLTRWMYSRFFLSTTSKAWPRASMSTLVLASVFWMLARRFSLRLRCPRTVATMSAHLDLASDTCFSSSAFATSNSSAIFCSFRFLLSRTRICSAWALALFSSVSSRPSICLFCSESTRTCSSFATVSDLSCWRREPKASILSLTLATSDWRPASFASQASISSWALSRSASTLSSAARMWLFCSCRKFISFERTPSL
mmetsp:Transcript_33629/g.71478  ORF Transcript_33629/g.71478 Transcript_33629/m.71478 type:complete len:224 (+) Transcript_33629:2193-2864(+)